LALDGEEIGDYEEEKRTRHRRGCTHAEDVEDIRFTYCREFFVTICPMAFREEDGKIPRKGLRI
jgi:hypothetical protein